MSGSTPAFILYGNQNRFLYNFSTTPITAYSAIAIIHSSTIDMSSQFIFDRHEQPVHLKEVKGQKDKMTIISRKRNVFLNSKITFREDGFVPERI